jgi:CBS domain-containing protein
MQIQDTTSLRDVMSTNILAVEPEDTIPETARRMSERDVGAAIVGPITSGTRPGIITERDLLTCVAEGRGPDYLRVADRFTPEAVTLPPDSSLQQAAKVMTSGSFRHLVVYDGGETVGVVSMRDLVGHWSRDGKLPGLDVPIKEAMNTDVLAVGLEDTLREAARRMYERGVGAAMVEPAKARRPPETISARELVRSVAGNQDPDTEQVANHLAPRRTFSAPDWSLSQAAEAMTKGSFQHILVVSSNGISGIISMRDLVRCLVRIWYGV